ncbi:MAG: hypothetical protein ACREX5_08310 [Achromobacter pestifer]
MNEDRSSRLDIELFSLVRNDWFFRIQKRIGLIPPNGSGVVRRAVLYALISWLPLLVASWFDGTLLLDGVQEPLLGHFGIQVRCLVAIPVLVLAEGIAHRIVPMCLDQFWRTGLVDEALAPRFRQVIADSVKLRNTSLPWIIIAGLVLAWTAAVWISPNPDELIWTGATGEARSFAAWWFLLVTRPLFSVLLLAWVWRLVLASVVLLRIARLPLRLVPSHPDRVGGLGFLSRFPIVFSPFIFSVSAVVAASWAHGVFYHEVPVPSLYVQMATLVVVLVIVGLAPLMVFTPILARHKKLAMLEYGVLLAQHGRAVDARWIQKQEIPDYPMLDAPELGPVADIQTLYQAVEAMRSVLINKGVLFKVAIPAAVPLLVVVATQWPLKSTLSKLLFTLL